ncbi:MAG: hypothetical protein KKF54_02725 [Candidatus Omnitrophica bacterium]|nr:hypothetical protein [Candidatus Omnitrophota bacterium]
MNKLSVIFIGLIFGFSFLYLHQKVGVYVHAYKLSQNSQKYNELIDKKDYLMYNFAKSISLVKVNQWAQDNDFSVVDKQRKLALNLKSEKGPIGESKLAFLYNSFLKFPSASSTALAEENE